MTGSKPITIRQLEVLDGIATAGSIRKAAKLLGLTQPTISAQLAKLETALGSELVSRDQGHPGVLTGAGELWARTASSVLTELEEGRTRHSEIFGHEGYTMSFATIPSHAGRSLGIAAAVARAIPGFSEVSVSLAPSSADLLDYLAIRKARIGLLAMTEELRQTRSLMSEEIYMDQIVWAVPRSIDPGLVRAVLSGDAGARDLPPALQKRVVVRAPHEWSDVGANWYRTRLPDAAPSYVSDLHVGAVEIVAAGLATCHVSMTLRANLPERIHDTVAFYETGLTSQAMVVVMPRHLMAVPSFARYFRNLTAALRDHYARALSPAALRPDAIARFMRHRAVETGAMTLEKVLPRSGHPGQDRCSDGGTITASSSDSSQPPVHR